MYEIWIIAFSGTSSVYFPLKSVMVPIEVPFMRTLAPMIGSPFLSITVPVIPFLLCWGDESLFTSFLIRKMFFPSIL